MVEDTSRNIRTLPTGRVSRNIYREYAEELVRKGAAYYAFDTTESLAEARAEAESRRETIYNRKTRKQMRNSLTLPEEEVNDLLERATDWTIRFKIRRIRSCRWTT